jgi:hypothetical protein
MASGSVISAWPSILGPWNVREWLVLLLLLRCGRIWTSCRPSVIGCLQVSTATAMFLAKLTRITFKAGVSVQAGTGEVWAWAPPIQTAFARDPCPPATYIRALDPGLMLSISLASTSQPHPIRLTGELKPRLWPEGLLGPDFSRICVSK